MIEIEIPEDVKKYEAKLIGPFTTRQIICLIGAAISGIGVYFLTNRVLHLETDAFIILLVLIAVPFALFGWIKPNEMKFEQYLYTIIRHSLLAPQHRVYKTENLYEQFDNLIAKELADAEAKNQKEKSANKSKRQEAK